MTTKKNTAGESFIEEIGQLSANSETERGRIRNCAYNLNKLKSRLNDAKGAHARLRNRAAGGEEGLDDAIQAKEQQIANLTTEIDEAEQTLRTSESCHADMLQQQESPNAQITQEDVLEYFSVLQETHDRVEHLRSLIEEQNAIKLEASEIDSRLPELEEERETILAAIAIGDAEQHEVDTVDAAIAKEEARLSDLNAQADVTISAAEAATSGLNRQLEDATKRLQALTEGRPQVIHACLHTELSHLGKQFHEASQALIGKFRRMVALELLCQELKPARQGGATVFTDDWIRLFLPGIQLQRLCTGDSGDLPSKSFHASQEANAGVFRELVSEIKQELNEAGIVL